MQAVLQPVLALGVQHRTRLAAADEQAQRGLGQRPVLDDVDGHMGGQMVDAVERDPEPEGEGLGRGDTDEQGSGQTRAGRDREGVDVA